MEKAKQTDELKVRVYDLTLSFVRKYKPRYYKQYRGELEDLAMDFYCNFLTPKSRVSGNEQTLLDKYDETITSLEYLLKISVQRMLIDRSRQNPGNVTSIDQFVEEFGDVISQAFGLTTDDYEEETVDNREFTSEFITEACAKFDVMNEKAKKAIIRQYQQVKNVLSPLYVDLFESILKPVEETVDTTDMFLSIEDNGCSHSCQVQQVTDKTVCLFYDGSVKLFNRETGEARGKAYRHIYLSDNALYLLLNMETYHSGMHREQFEMQLS